jgi:serine/threonine-protein kinase
MKSGDLLGGKYRLEQKIGEGGMGEVWSAEHQATGGKVALKLILPDRQELRSADLRERLMREARACGKLKHRNIVQIYDVGQTPQGDPFLVLELLHGQALDKRLKEKRRIEPRLAARITGEIASALAAAHAAKVIHRDLKPANIFLHREEGMAEDSFIVKVLDFGVSKSLDSADGPATMTGAVVGSPAYMSPEQVGMRKDLDNGTDIWSLGIVLYELLTGVRPFTGSVDEVVRQILMTSIKPVPAPSDRVRGIPPELDAIVARCTMPKRSERFADAAELSRALMIVAETSQSAQIPVSVPAPSAPGHERKPTITGIGPTLPIQAHERKPTFTGGEATTPMPAQQRISTWTGGNAAPSPDASNDDESDLAATLPLQGRMLADLKLARNALSSASPAPAPSSSPGEQQAVGTQLLSPNELPASPMPAWRQEMQQAIAAHRQSSASLEAVVPPEEAPHGGTQMITPGLMARTTGPVDPSGTTSAAGSMVQPLPGAMPVGVGQEALGKPRQKKPNAALVFGGLGVGIVATIGVIGFIVMNLVKPGGEATATSTTAATPEAMNSAAPTAAAAPISTAVAPVPTAEPQLPEVQHAKEEHTPPEAPAPPPVVDPPKSPGPTASPPQQSPPVKKAPAATGCKPSFLTKCPQAKYDPTRPF